MFRLTKDFQPKPGFLILCDVRSCAQCASGEMVEGANPGQAAMAFLQMAQQAGWLVAVDGHVCPGHAQQQRGEEKRIQVVSSLAARN